MYYGDYNGLGIGGSEIRKSIMAGYDDGKTGFSLGTNFWSGMKGIDGESMKQRTGVVGLHSGDFRFMYENDGAPFNKIKTGDGNDSYRTAAVRIGIGNFSAGFNLFTGVRNDYSGDSEKLNQGCNGNFDTFMPHDVVQESGPQYRLGALYVGYGSNRVGINSDKYVRHPIQDLWAHNSKNWIMGDTRQPGFDTLSNTVKPYLLYQTNNSFTTW